ncbi:sericin 1-like [Prorops nasuta]|uniref:sericin 1-like n=1 Tax=Prorops nasuta TaxID=863751 RepID=UPI0034CEC418
MARIARCIVIFCVILGLTWADERIELSKAEHERRRNTPPELTPDWAPQQTRTGKKNEAPQARFLPFTASFSLNAGQNNAHTLSVGADREGISLSQSTSQSTAASFGNTAGSLASSQSSSFSAGLNGFAAADSNSFSLNHPIFGANTQADSNAFSIGQGAASANGNAANHHASSNAQTSLGPSQTSAPSFPERYPKREPNMWSNIQPSYEETVHLDRNRPMLVISHSPSSWNEQNPKRGPIELDIDAQNTIQNGDLAMVLILKKLEVGIRMIAGVSETVDSQGPKLDSVDVGDDFVPQVGFNSNEWNGENNWPTGGLQINAASVSSSSSSRPGGFSIGQSSSQSGSGSRGPISTGTVNHVQTSGNAAAHAQGSVGSVHQGNNGSLQGSFDSGTISATSSGNGQSLGTSIAGNRGGNSRGQVNTHTIGAASSQGTANSGSVSNIRFPDESNLYDVPKEFIRNRNTSRSKGRNEKAPIESIISDIEDTVVDLFDLE